MATGDTYLLEKCRQQIEAAINWGDSANWANEDFDNLVDAIEEKTSVRLSISTLKRIWGRVQYNSSPTAATLNTLAKFIGYENWRSFQQKNKIEEPPVAQEEIVTAPNPVEIPIAAAPVKQSRKALAIVLLAVVIVISLGLVTIFRSKKTIAPAKIPYAFFESKKTTDDLPNSVVFNYNASAFHSDSVYLQQNWDTTRRQKIPPDGRQVTSIYYYPGYFNSKLIVDGNIIKESPVFIKTKGWKGIVEQKPVPFYLSNTEIAGKGVMAVAAQTLISKLGTPVFNEKWVYFNNVRTFDSTDANDFSFSTTVRNTSTVEQCLCRKIRIMILGTQSAIIIPLSDNGCIADINLLTGYNWIYGKEHDLSAFGGDMQQFQQLAFTVQKSRLKVYLNNKMVMDVSQPVGIGQVVGIRYAFEGTGEVKNVMLASHGKTVYEENFSNLPQHH